MSMNMLARRIVPAAVYANCAMSSSIKRARSGFNIGESTSKFGKKEEKFFNIQIVDTNLFSDIVENVKCSPLDIEPKLQDLLLENFDRDAIRIYKPALNKALSKHAQTFLFKLSLVVNNNYAPIEPQHVENYIHDLMDNVLKTAGLEDGTDLILMPCVLRLQVGTKSLAAYADMEGRRGTEIVWVLDEDKHKFDRRWKRGDIQLIANMVAAAQANELLLKRVYPSHMLGMKFDADCVYFYSARVTKEYLEDLATEGKPTSELIVKKFPKDRELSLSVPNDRKEIFSCLCALKKYAMMLEPQYVP